MARPCSSCDSENRVAIDQKFKSGQTIETVRLYLLDRGEKISDNALQRHRSKHVLPTRVAPGPRPASTDLLELVRDRVVEDVAAGVQHPNITQGLQAQKQIDDRLARGKDHDLMIHITQAMFGGAGQPQIWSPEREAIEGEFRPLLLSPPDEAYVEHAGRPGGRD